MNKVGEIGAVVPGLSTKIFAYEVREALNCFDGERFSSELDVPSHSSFNILLNIIKRYVYYIAAEWAEY